MLAPAASDRDRVVPEPPDEDDSCAHTTPVSRDDEPPPLGRQRRRRRYSWAELVQRVFLADVLVCEHCGGPRKVLAFLTEPNAIRRILEHLGLPAEPPVVATARPPPDPVLGFA